MTELPPPGWYADADDSRYQRWWDGRVWTTTVRLTAGPAEATAEAHPLPPRNATAVVSLAFGVAAAVVMALGVLLTGMDPLVALLILVFGLTAIATGIAAIVRANRLRPRVGRGKGIAGLSLGAAAVVLTIAGVAVILFFAAAD